MSASNGVSDSSKFFYKLILKSPQTGIEAFISFPQSVTVVSNISDHGTKIATTLIMANRYNGNAPYISDNVLVQRENASSQRIQITLQREDPKVVYHKQILSPQTFVTRCKKGTAASTQYNCMRGISISATCDGVFQGSIQSSCPYNLSYPICNVFDSVTFKKQTGSCPAINTTVNTVTCVCPVESNLVAFFVNSMVQNTTISKSTVYIAGPLEGQVLPSTSAGTLYQYRFILGSILIAICMMIQTCIVAYFKSSTESSKNSDSSHWWDLQHIPRWLGVRNRDPYLDEDEHKEADNIPEHRPEVPSRDLEVNAPTRASIRLSLGRSSALENLIMRLKQLFPAPAQEDEKIDDVDDDGSSYFSVSSIYGRVGGTGGVSFGIDVSIQTALKAAASPRTTTVLNISVDSQADPTRVVEAADDGNGVPLAPLNLSYMSDELREDDHNTGGKNEAPIGEYGDFEEKALTVEVAEYPLTGSENQARALANQLRIETWNTIILEQNQSNNQSPFPSPNAYLNQKSSPYFNRSPAAGTHTSLFARRTNLVPPYLSPISISSRPETPHLSTLPAEPFPIEVTHAVPTTQFSAAITPQAEDSPHIRSRPAPMTTEEMELYRKSLVLTPRRSPISPSPSQRRRDHKASSPAHTDGMNEYIGTTENLLQKFVFDQPKKD
jgi:hypothetical protein